MNKEEMISALKSNEKVLLGVLNRFGDTGMIRKASKDVFEIMNQLRKMP